jgi:monofunctional biosynthetic peptidoglycan transglycosylase
MKSKSSPEPGRALLRLMLRRVVPSLAALLALYQVGLLANVVWLRADNPATTAMMRARGTPVDQRWVPLAEISPHLVHAVIAAEDRRFLRHGGVDWLAVREAHEANRRAGRVVRGGSTITQQLAKNLFLSPRRSWARKAQEALLAFELELVADKARIMELYLNVIEWDEGIFGVEAAAQHYLHRSARDLTAGEGAYLAAIIPGPRQALNPRHNPRRHAQARHRILLAMRTVALPRWDPNRAEPE